MSEDTPTRGAFQMPASPGSDVEEQKLSLFGGFSVGLRGLPSQIVDRARRVTDAFEFKNFGVR
jgi:hypothetical protein